MLMAAATEHWGKDGPLYKLTGTIVYSCDGQFYVSPVIQSKTNLCVAMKAFCRWIKICNQLALTREN